MSTAVNPLSSTPPASGSISSTPVTDPLASESTFLKLLVSQLQNQDPLNPVDSNQFVSQLTSYSQLEQLIGIHSDTTALSQAVSTTPSSTTATGVGATGPSDGTASPASSGPATSTSSTSQTNSTTGAN